MGLQVEFNRARRYEFLREVALAGNLIRMAASALIDQCHDEGEVDETIDKLMRTEYHRWTSSELVPLAYHTDPKKAVPASVPEAEYV